jgi:hypothetical protein
MSEGRDIMGFQVSGVRTMEVSDFGASEKTLWQRLIFSTWKILKFVT